MKPGYQADMAKHITRGLVVRPSGRGVTLEIPCTGGHTVEYHLDKMLPPDAMPRQLSQRGWRSERRKATCPECVAKEKTMGGSSHLVTRAELTADIAPRPAAVTEVQVLPTTTEATAAAKRVHRTVMEALMIAYDDDTKRYTSGYTDAKVAAETGAAVGYVQKVREDYFGPLAEPSEVVTLRKEIGAMKDEAVAIATKAAEQFKELDKRIAAASDRITALAKANGWKA